MWIIGRGRAALTKFCAVMNMPGPVVKKSFETHVKAIARVSKQVAEPEMDKAARDLNLMPGKMKPWILLFLVMEHGREEDFNPFMEWCQLFMWTQEKLWTMK